MAYWKGAEASVFRPYCSVCNVNEGEYFHPVCGILCNKCICALQYAKPGYHPEREQEAIFETALEILQFSTDPYAISRIADYMAEIAEIVSRNPIARIKKV